MVADDSEARRTSRTPRAVGMRAMVDATVELLRERSPDAVTIRDIAARCGHHHRFVAGWFGSKSGLFRAAFDQMADEAAAAFVLEAPASGGGPREPIVRLLQLLSWLATHDPDSLEPGRPTPLIDRVSELYAAQFGLGEDLARLSAQRLTGYFLLTVLYPGPLGVEPGDFDAHLDLEMRIVQSLAAAEGGEEGPP